MEQSPAQDQFPLQRFREELQHSLSPARYEHSLRVAQTARALARRAGVDPEQAWLAGLVHDCAREMPDAAARELAQHYGIDCGGRNGAPEFGAELLHGPLAARLLADRWGLRDPAILQAVARHTTGAPGMEALDLVLFVADASEPGRSHPAVAAIRAAAQADLRRAACLALASSISYLESTGRWVHPLSRAALRELQQGFQAM